MALMRLDKYLSSVGIGTRTEVKELIRKKLVQVNGTTETSPERKVDSETDHISCRGQDVSYVEYEYYMLNKPAGVVSAVTDSRDRTVVQLITSRRRKDLFPVGRLDKDTEGLLLITNDGPLCNRLLSPKKHVEKQYFARVRGSVTDNEVKLFAEGLDIGDEKPTLPARLKICRASEESEILLTICEGRFHQVKRMFQAVGMEVIYLKRLSMGSLKLDETLAVGEYRPLTREELESLYQAPKERDGL